MIDIVRENTKLR